MEQIPIILLKNEKVVLTPLVEDDFERLFQVAGDPLIWEQHPNPDRFKREVFQKYFEGAIQSEGAFLI
jgi:N-acetyltransferase